MRVALSFAASSMALAAPVAANPMVSNIPSEPPYIANPFPQMYDGGPMITANEWLAKLRRQCRSNNAYDQKACSTGLAALKRGHAELQLRRAAENAVAD